MGVDLLEYADNGEIVETKGNRGKTTGIASCYVRLRNKGGVLDNNASGDFGSAGWWNHALIDGDPAALERSLSTYLNNTSMVTKTIGNQITGDSEYKTTLSLKNLTPYIKNVALNNGANAGNFDARTSSFPGTRTMTITLSTDLITANQLDFSFTTTDTNTGVTTSATAVSETFATDHDTTMAAIITAIEANTNINATSTSFTGDVITITTNAGCFLTVTSAAVVTLGASQPTVTPSETDSSVLSTTVDESNGAIGKLSFGVASGGAAIIQTALTNGAGALPQIRILTGTSATGTQYEYPHVSRVDTTNNVVYLNEALSQLPLDSAAVDVIADFEYYPGGNQLSDYEMQLEFRDHSNKVEKVVYAPLVNKGSGSGLPTHTAEGEKVTIEFVLHHQLFTINSVNELLPFRMKEVNSAVGTY
jgi:hypothetical protein